ncbi:MAG: penicillin acylase family protein [Cyclobacteriaceae bacterium]
MKFQHYLICLALSFGATAQFNPSEIQIMRDKWGVPHIYAPTDAQVSYGLAWAHAEDDFKTIQLSLLAATGRLGQTIGKDGAPIDYVTNLMKCKEIVDEHFDTVSPDFIRLVEGYTAGINAYAAANPKEVLLKKVFPISVKEVFTTYVFQLAVFDGADKTLSALFGNRIMPFFTGTGSNGIAINRKKTESDEVFLAVNAHQPLEGPVGWYEAHLISDEGWNMLGGLFPGGPTVFHGTNENLGWAHTVNYPDKIDVFQLEMHPEEENKYKIDDEWHDLEYWKIKLKVKLFLGIKINVKRDAYYSKYGPVVKNQLGYFGFHMAVFDEIRATEQWYRMNKATNLKEFKKVLEMTAIPSFNMIYADRDDNIFYVSNGKIPMRDPKYDWTKTLPGNTSSTLPGDYHPFSDLPQLTNPDAGYLFNTNNTPYNATAKEENLDMADFDSTMGFVQRENNRSIRFMELIDQHDKLSYQEFKDIKFDVTLPDSLAYNINVNAVFRMDPKLARRAAPLVEVFQKWNRRGEIEDVGAAQMKVFYSHLSGRRGVIDDEAVTPVQMIESLLFTFDYFMKYYGKIDISLGEYQKLARGDKAVPLRGLPDVLAAMWTRPYVPGKVQGNSGESYILLAKYPKEGLPIIETIHAYGNSSKSDSPHYTDQMEDFTKLKLKPMSLDLEDARKNAVRTYSPQ